MFDIVMSFIKDVWNAFIARLSSNIEQNVMRHFSTFPLVTNGHDFKLPDCLQACSKTQHCALQCVR